jgi:hypothetical protein
VIGESAIIDRARFDVSQGGIVLVTAAALARAMAQAEVA